MSHAHGNPSFHGRGNGRGGRQEHQSYNRDDQSNKRTRFDPSQVNVLTNFFKVNLKLNPNKDVAKSNGYYMYHIEVQDACRKKDENGNLLQDENGNLLVVPRAPRTKVDSKRESKEHPDLTRAIMEQLKSDLWTKWQIVLATDGHQFGVSPYPICDNASSQKEAASQSFQVRLASDYLVQKLSETEGRQRDLCRELLEYQKNNSWYIVTLKQLNFIPIEEINNVLNSPSMALQSTMGPSIAHCIDAVIRSTMLSTLLAPGKSPRMFYLPPNQHTEADVNRLLDELQRYHRPRDTTRYVPLVGIRQNTIYVGNKLWLGADTQMAYFDREKRVPEGAEKAEFVPVLDFSDGGVTIAGERIPQARRAGESLPRIVDGALQQKIQEALAGIKFHVRYPLVRDKDGKEAAVPKMQTFRNLKLRLPKDGTASIIWAANDATMYSFEWSKGKEGPKETTSTYDYYLRRYGYQLQHPNLPLIGTYRGYFPVEFLYQALSKTKNANSDSQKRDALAFNDKFAATKRIDHIRFVREKLESLQGSGLPTNMVLERFNLSFSMDPLQMTAKILTAPSLFFANEKIVPRNGSWNLLNVKFHSPSTLNSFAVVDLTGGKSKDVVRALFRKMEEHGMELPINNDVMEAVAAVTVNCNDRQSFQSLKKAVSDAIYKAKDYFLKSEDACPQGFRTLSSFVYDGKVGSMECCCAYRVGEQIGLVLNPLDEKGQPAFTDSRWPSHHIKLPSGQTFDGRLYLVVDLEINGRNASVLLDPFDLQGTPTTGFHGFYEGEWRRVSAVKDKVYKYFDGIKPEILGATAQANWIHLVHSWQVECPAVILICLPEKEAKPYKALKFLTNAEFGVQSQCIVVKSYNSQRNVGGYLSNVALKLNTKLANSWSDARAWTSNSVNSVNHVPWLAEAPTLIIGLGISHSTSGWTAVVATGCLDNFQLTNEHGGFMQMGHESKIISGDEGSVGISQGTMKELVMSLAYQYSRRQLPGPVLRVIFYRDGGADGSFEKFKAAELEGIKSAFREVNAVLCGEACPGCASRDCREHMPLITYIVAQSDHGIRIVPDEQGKGNGRANNVPSGTCVDHTIVSSSEGNPNFLLIPQHGLKGTSKAVYYKVLVNENSIVPKHLLGRGTELTAEILQKLTFAMSFQYGTATKSVRHVPVVLYSKRLAEQMIGYVNYLKDERLVREPHSVEASLLGGQDSRCWERTDQNVEFNIPILRNGMLPAFGPFNPKLANGSIAEDGEKGEQETTYLCCSLRNPFRPHLAA